MARSRSSTVAPRTNSTPCGKVGCGLGVVQTKVVPSVVCRMTDYLLEMRNVSKRFPGVLALDNVSFCLIPGEVHVLLGENGAGKSTLIKILSGAYAKTQGEILIQGQKAEINGPTDAFKYGISVIYQEFNLNPYMPIYENIFLGKEFITKSGLIDKRKAVEETKRISEVVGLSASPTSLVKNLSVAQKQLVEIAKAIVSDAKIVVFDEPTATLTESEIEKLFQIINGLKRKGVGIIYISHRLREFREIGDRCTVLRDGRCVGTVELSQVTEDDLIRMMVGRAVDFNKRKASCASTEVVLEVRNLCYNDVLSSISFDVRKGEILGISGLVGAGRTELAKCVIGEYRKTSGEVYLNDRLLRISSPSDAIAQGIVYLSEDRRSEGLILRHDVKSNISLPALGKIVVRGLLSRAKERGHVNSLVGRLSIKTPNLEAPAQDLSGGNQQKVIIAKWLFRGAEVYIFDEPTRGIDVGAKEEIYRIMETLVRDGASIIMISSDLVEILRMSDRILVMRQGRAVAVLENEEELAEEDVLAYEIGERV